MASGGPRRAGTKHIVRKPNTPAGLAKARLWLQLLCGILVETTATSGTSVDGERVGVLCGNTNGCANQRGVGDSKKVAGIMIGSAYHEKDRSPCNKVFFSETKARLGQLFDEVVGCKSS